MSPDRFSTLTRLYPDALRRGGQVYPAVISRMRPDSFEPPALVTTDAALTTAESHTLDAEHLKRRLRSAPELTNGPTLRWLSNDGDRVRVAHARYFDMLASCDALRSEIQHSTDWSDLSQQPLRAGVHSRAGDPLHSGAGRSAAIGVSVLLTVPRTADGTPGRSLVVGQRPHKGPSGSDIWHVAPSGMLEWEASGRHIRETVVRELKEELGIDLSVTDIDHRLTMLGMAQDLLMLKPDLVVRLDLTDAETPETLRPMAEFRALELVEITDLGWARFWRAFPPARLVPAAAGAIALLQDSLTTR